MTQVQESGSRARTRQAIVDAAIEVLGRNPAAPLSEIATAAEVGRTTLHRYFAERSELMTAVNAEALERLNRATQQARMSEGTGGAAIQRLCQEYFDLGGLLSLIFSEPGLVASQWEGSGECDEGSISELRDGSRQEFPPLFVAMVERGHRDGSIDPELPAGWVQSLIWSQLYAGWAYLADSGASRHEVLRLLLRTVGGAVAAKAA